MLLLSILLSFFAFAFLVTAITPGNPVQVVSPLAASSTGTTNSLVFAAQPRPNGSDCNLTLTAIPVAAVTTLTVDLEVSSDGGTTWQKKHVGIALIATSVSTQAQEQYIQPGLLYRVNVTTNTGGTSISINATIQ